MTASCVSLCVCVCSSDALRKWRKTNLEHRCAIKFCVRLNENATETYEKLKQGYGEHAVSKAQVFSLYTALVPQLQLWHLLWLVNVFLWATCIRMFRRCCTACLMETLLQSTEHFVVWVMSNKIMYCKFTFLRTSSTSRDTKGEAHAAVFAVCAFLDLWVTSESCCAQWCPEYTSQHASSP